MACPGPVPHWEVSLLVDPPQQPEGSPVLSLKEHQALISLAEAARDRGDAHRAYSLAEKAYTGRRAISSLLYALDIRMHELKEPAFCAAAYELILGRTLSAEDRTVCETAQCAAIKLLETERERDEASEGTARLAQRAGELRDAAERFRAAAGYSSKSLSSTMPTVTMAVVDAVDAAADVDAVKDVAAERGTTPGPQAESSPQWLRQAAPALYGVGSSSASTSDAAAPSTSVVATRSPARRIASLDDDDDEEEGNDDESRPPPVHIPRTPRGTPETMMGLIGRSRCAAASPLYTSRVPTLPFEIQRSREMNASTDSGVSLRSHRLVRFNSHRLHEEEEEEESTSLEAIAERQRARARERERAHERERAYERERARQSERARRTPSTPPLISPLLPRRLPRREHAGTLAPRMPQGPCGGVFGTVHLLVSQLQSALHSSSRLFTAPVGSSSPGPRAVARPAAWAGGAAAAAIARRAPPRARRSAREIPADGVHAVGGAADVPRLARPLLAPVDCAQGPSAVSGAGRTARARRAAKCPLDRDPPSPLAGLLAARSHLQVLPRVASCSRGKAAGAS